MKTLCSIVAGLVLLITTTVLSAAKAPFDGNQLLTWCTDALRWIEQRDMVVKGNREVVFANASYCRGFIEGLRAMNNIAPFVKHLDKELDEIDPVCCFPRDIAIPESQLLRIVVRFLQTHLTLLHLGGDFLAIRALLEAFPCAPAAARPQR
jgi:hypothetical protein